MRPALAKIGISTSFSTRNSLGNQLSRTAPKASNDNKVPGVYKIECKKCVRVYFGETGRDITQRKYDHKQDIKDAKVSNSLFVHMQRNPGHSFDLDNISLVHKTNHKAQRQVVESALIASSINCNLKPGDFPTCRLIAPLVIDVLKLAPIIPNAIFPSIQPPTTTVAPAPAPRSTHYALRSLVPAPISQSPASLSAPLVVSQASDVPARSVHVPAPSTMADLRSAIPPAPPSALQHIDLPIRAANSSEPSLSPPATQQPLVPPTSLALRTAPPLISSGVSQPSVWPSSPHQAPQPYPKLSSVHSIQSPLLQSQARALPIISPWSTAPSPTSTKPSAKQQCHTSLSSSRPDFRLRPAPICSPYLTPTQTSGALGKRSRWRAPKPYKVPKAHSIAPHHPNLSGTQQLIPVASPSVTRSQTSRFISEIRRQFSSPSVSTTTSPAAQRPFHARLPRTVPPDRVFSPAMTRSRQRQTVAPYGRPVPHS